MSDYKSGKARIPEDDIVKISEITGYPVGWFYMAEEESETPENVRKFPIKKQKETQPEGVRDYEFEAKVLKNLRLWLKEANPEQRELILKMIDSITSRNHEGGAV